VNSPDVRPPRGRIPGQQGAMAGLGSCGDCNELVRRPPLCFTCNTLRRMSKLLFLTFAKPNFFCEKCDSLRSHEAPSPKLPQPDLISLSRPGLFLFCGRGTQGSVGSEMAKGSANSPDDLGRRAEWEGTCRLRLMRAPRPFPPPWTVIDIPGGFRVQDANHRALAYIYFHPGSEGREDEFLTELEAQQLADHFARSRDNAPGLSDSDQNPTEPQ
jgi:hypothetical protein